MARTMLTPKEVAAIDEFLRDAASCGRLTDWETEFVTNLQARRAQYGSRMMMSDAQWAAFGRIEAKLYET